MRSQNFCILQAFTQMAQMKGKSDLEQTNCSQNLPKLPKGFRK